MTQRTNKTTNDLMASTAVQASSKNDMKKEDVALTPAQEKELEVCAERLGALGRKSTEQAFAYGEELARAQAILPAKKFGKWLTANSGIGTKTAKNYTRVYKELAPYRDRLVKAAVAPSVMFALLAADDTAIETVLGAFENGERPTVETIKAMVVSEAEPQTSAVDLLDMPGRAACLKIAEQRAKSNIAQFYDLLEKVLPPVEEAVAKFAAGKNVAMSPLAKLIEFDCRHAHDLFELTLAPLYINPRYENMNWRSTVFGETSAWGRVQIALDKLGGFDSWPKKTEFRTWVVDEVYPLLKFVLRGDALEKASAPDQSLDDEAQNILNREMQRDLTKTRARLDAPKTNADNIVELAQRQKTRNVISTAEA
ncbi:MAG: hypothetical protein JWM58_3809 [Rhizobium sp.]|nr:hypothetical protein [Rhizobium sp.]